MSEVVSTQLIRGRALADDDWRVVPANNATGPAPLDGVSAAPTDLGEKCLLLPLPVWLEQRLDLRTSKASSGSRLGVWLAPNDDPATLAGDVAMLDLIAVYFPKFVDGRGYSTAALLRQRYGYRGELRAFGDVGRDQLFYLSRVGFDSFLISEGRDGAAAIRSLNDFSESYQTAFDQSTPLFRRRGVQAAL